MAPEQDSELPMQGRILRDWPGLPFSEDHPCCGAEFLKPNIWFSVDSYQEPTPWRSILGTGGIWKIGTGTVPSKWPRGGWEGISEKRGKEHYQLMA